MLTDQLIKIAAPFGRDLEVRAFNLIEAPQPPLRISTETITAAIADLGLGPEAIAVNAAMLPILRMLAERYGESLLKLYPTYLETEAFNKLLKGVYEFNGKDVKANDLSSSDAAALKKVIEPLNELLDVEREKGRLALIGFAGELATLACVSLGSGVELRTALSAGALMCIRPYSDPLGGTGDRPMQRGAHPRWPRSAPGTRSSISPIRTICPAHPRKPFVRPRLRRARSGACRSRSGQPATSTRPPGSSVPCKSAARRSDG